jgi:hypothetical protein
VPHPHRRLWADLVRCFKTIVDEAGWAAYRIGGNPRIHIRVDPRVLYGLETRSIRHELAVHQFIYAMVEAYLARRGVAPRHTMDRALLSRATVTRLKALLSMLEFEIDTLDVATVKGEVDKGSKQSSPRS